MQFIKIYAVFVMLIVASCKKERTCQCTNSISTYDAGTLDATKKYAKKYCEDLSAGETECNLKE